MDTRRGSIPEVFLAFLRLGCTSFGGPVAHLGYFRDQLVLRRKWVDEATYADIVALCQFLPGPASSQIGMVLGIERAGLLGGVAAWVGFTMPSAILLVAFASVLARLGTADAAWVHGLKVAAVVIVATAVRGMAATLCPDRARGTIAVLAAVVALAWTTALSQIVIMVVAALAGWAVLRSEETPEAHAIVAPVPRVASVIAAVAFSGLLVGLPLLARATASPPVMVFSQLYRVGSLVFGGGHVVLPLLQAEVVTPGWVTREDFLAGYGAANAVPGPLFSLAAYLGACMKVQPNGPLGALVALVAIFLPSYLLVVAALPFWQRLRRSRACQAAMKGTNAAVVGLLLAALYRPVWTSAILTAEDFALALVGFALHVTWRAPSWAVVVLCAVASAVLAMR